MKAFGGACLCPVVPGEAPAASVNLAESLEDFPHHEASDGSDASLIAALLEVAVNGVSFATPGHRCGRSCRSVLSATVAQSGV